MFGNNQANTNRCTIARRCLRLPKIAATPARVMIAAAWHPAGVIADDNLGAATAEASAPARPVPMLPPVTTAILSAKVN